MCGLTSWNAAISTAGVNSVMKHLFVQWNDIHVRTKFLVATLIAILLVSVGALLAIQIPQHAYNEKLYESSSQTVSLFANQMQREIRNFESISYRILTDTSLQQSLSTMKEESPGTVAWIAAQKYVGDRVAYFGLWFSDTVSFQLKTTSGVSYSQFFGASINVDELTDERMAYASGRSGRLVWLTERGDDDLSQLFLLREIREIKGLTMDPLAYISIEVNFTSLVNRYLNAMDKIGSPLLCAVYKDGACLYASNKTIRNLSIDDNSYSHVKVDGKDMLCVNYSASGDMRYVILVDYTGINATIADAIEKTVLVIAAVAILSLLICWLIITGVLKHLQALLVKFDTFAATGEAVAREGSPYAARRDEIGRLHRHFDHMTRVWNQMQKDKEMQQQLLQEKQMQQLRAQVRPHFLYNTLESIYCLAVSNQDKRIAEMTDALGKMLRASINDTRDIVTVAEDLQVAQDYMRIQTIRLGDRMRIEYDIDETIMKCLIPSMTIQPLVENAVHHAAEEMLDECIIRIVGVTNGNDMRILIEDNGPGMDNDILEKLDAGIVKPEGLGIGLRNIHRRIQYLFSSEYGLIIQRESGKTIVAIHLPKRYAGPDV